MEKVTNEELARIIASGFEQTASKDDIKRLENRMDKFEERIDHVDGRLDHIDARLGRIEVDIEEMRGNIVYRDEFEDLAARVKYLEAKIGVNSGT